MKRDSGRMTGPSLAVALVTCTGEPSTAITDIKFIKFIETDHPSVSFDAK
jgi:hypothetical protein